MSDQASPFKKDAATPFDAPGAFSDVASRLKGDVENLMSGLDVQKISSKVEDFGRKNPVGLAAAALTLGLAVGFLFRHNSERSSDQVI